MDDGAIPVVKTKGKAMAMEAEVPWSEKYRPKSLDEVAAHKDIIDTSEESLKFVFVILNDDKCQHLWLACN